MRIMGVSLVSNGPILQDQQGQKGSARNNFLTRNLDGFGSSFISIRANWRRLAWPLCKDDTHNSLRANSSQKASFEALEINICKLEVENGVGIGKSLAST